MIAQIIFNGQVIPIGGKVTQADLNNIINSTNTINNSIIDINDRLNTMNSNFQAGCDTIVGALTAKGVTPTTNSPANISSAIYDMTYYPQAKSFYALATDKLSSPSNNYIDYTIYENYVTVHGLINRVNNYYPYNINGDVNVNIYIDDVYNNKPVVFESPVVILYNRTFTINSNTSGNGYKGKLSINVIFNKDGNYIWNTADKYFIFMLEDMYINNTTGRSYYSGAYFNGTIEVPNGAEKVAFGLGHYQLANGLPYSLDTLYSSGSNSGYFRDVQRFNPNIILPNTIKSLSYAFYSLRTFDAELIIPESVEDCSGMLYDCESYNKNINIPDSVIDCDNLLYNAIMFNSYINFGNNVTNCRFIFRNAISFDKPVYFPDSIEYLDWAFERDWASSAGTCHPSWNKYLSINSSSSYNNSYYNSRVYIGKNCKSCRYMFNNQRRFNKPVDIAATDLKDVAYMFKNCESFNQPICINGNNCYMQETFSGSGFNSTLKLNGSFYSCFDIFSNYFINFSGTIIFGSNFRLTNTWGLDNFFRGASNIGRINVVYETNNLSMRCINASSKTNFYFNINSIIYSNMFSLPMYGVNIFINNSLLRNFIDNNNRLTSIFSKYDAIYMVQVNQNCWRDTSGNNVYIYTNYVYE